MGIAVILIGCLIAHPSQCQTIPVGLSVGSTEACIEAGNIFVGTLSEQNEWVYDIDCVDEDDG